MLPGANNETGSKTDRGADDSITSITLEGDEQLKSLDVKFH